jgi:hypothetical protein
MAFFSGFSDELLKLANRDEEDDEKKTKKKKSFIRKAGPGLGALAGLGLAAATKKPLLTGIGGGATVGWIPDITASLVEAIKDKKKEIENKKTP